VALFALVALAIIVVTGAAVRLTDSGLGCPRWPNCEPGSLAPRGATGTHGTIEWLNRLFTGVVSVAVMLAVFGAYLRRPRRRDLVWLAFGLVAGVLAQIVLGGLTVIFDLRPQFVMAHFLVSMALIATATVLHVRAGLPETRTVPPVPRTVTSMARWVTAAACIVLVTGTVVTGSGPHGGDERAPRLSFFVPDVARIHGIAVNILVAGTLGLIWLAYRTGAERSVRRKAEILLAVEVAQASVGYTQYATGVPEALVAVHVLGAVLVWIAMMRLLLACGPGAKNAIYDGQRTRERVAA
jgi:cytochrome c oxidase assembly protein subunit 15